MHFKVESAKDLSERQATVLLNRFKSKGWQPKVSAQPRKNSNYISINPGPAAAQQRKVLAMWNALGYDMAKLHTRVKTQFGVDRFEWLDDPKALHVLITDLEHRTRQLNAPTKARRR
jgi:hypothetical protein